MSRFSVSNLRNYTSHISRGALLLIGALVILGLVAATYFYGDPARDTDVVPEEEITPEETLVPETEEEAFEEDEGHLEDDEVVAPETIVDAGPVNYGLILFALIGLAVLYRQSTRQLEAAYVKTRQ